MSEEEFRSRLLDMKYLGDQERVYAKEIEMNDDEIPERFEAREKWPECQSITTIRDQANCVSCWAVSAASAMSDRVCVQSKGRIKTVMSDTDILACCGSYCGYGCNGGFNIKAWQYAMRSGSCSGGLHRQKGVCKPYAFHPCGRHVNQTYYGECTVTLEKTPLCRTMCQLDYPVKYENDKIYATSAYNVPATEKAIQKEIMTNGPVQASHIVYADFRAYKRGIYKHTYGGQIGGNAIKIVGWGVDNGTKYWTISNSWNSDWGEDGYFRMIRGVNECEMESMVVAGMMKV
ncbi:papain family cysteine protease [Oesophagostomum dentatum]|uniref:Papain family cysteine protease n=1 Tax=Oesophagostomum dentatum TaxID=61180 RepID=A0A0B1TVA4_OESDE|nr:papain family cysteine protease [Oesophagostomum dentatum]